MSSTTTTIGLSMAIIVAMNAMIGAGIFTAPAALLTLVGPASIVAFILVAAGVWVMALAFARLARLVSQEGGFYAYAHFWGGHSAGMVAAFLYLIGLIISMGLLGQITGSLLHQWIPGVSEKALGISALLFLVLFNILGVKISQLWQYILIACTFFPLLAMIVFALFNIHTEYLTPFAPYGWWALVPAVQVVIYSFLGFECTTSLFSLVRDPEKNLPRAITLSILFTAILYIAFMAAVVLSIPQSSVSYPKELISHLLAKTYPAFSWLATLIAISLVPTILGTIHSMVWGASMLVVSLFNVSSSSCLTCVRTSSYKNQLGVLLVGAGICVSLLTFTSLNLFFSLTAVFIVSAYLSALVALLKNTRGYRLRDWAVVIGGIKVAVIIFLCAMYSLLNNF